MKIGLKEFYNTDQAIQKEIEDALGTTDPDLDAFVQAVRV